MIMEDEVIMLDDLGGISEDKPVIKVIGVGGGGTNAVNHMYELGINNVEFVVCNTDCQSLRKSPVPIKIQLGSDGHGAGNDPHKGRESAEYSLDKVKSILQDSTKMVFVTAGMGGGTGTGAAPLIAKTAKDMGILTVGIVTIPFRFEGNRRIGQAIKGVDEMRSCVDSILVISTERISKIYHDYTLKNAFACADDILATAAKGIAEIITLPGYINVDLEDVKTVMTDSGDAVMGSSREKGEGRALNAIQNALDSPLLLSTKLTGARDILLNIAYGSDGILVDELTTITEYLQSEVQCDDNQIIWGATEDPNLESDELNITIVATGFNDGEIDGAIFKDSEKTFAFKRPVAKVETRVASNPVIVDVDANKINSYYGDDKRSVKIASTPKVNVANTTKPFDMPAEPVSFDDEDDMPTKATSSSCFMEEMDIFGTSVSMNDRGIHEDDKNSYLHDNVD